MAGPIADFWRLFASRAADLAATGSADTPVYDALLEQLQRVDRGLYLELSTSSPGACELIITADGDRALFPTARAVVAAAPPVPGWTVRALKPRLGLPRTATWEGVRLTISALVFDPLRRPGSDELGLRVFVPGLAKEDARAAHAAVVRALDHALGEERFAEAVQHVEVRPLHAGVAATELIPLRDLESYLEGREQERP